MTNRLICLECPLGCGLTASRQGEEVTVTGNNCPRGAAYALAELTNPCRTLTTTVRTVFADFPRLPVRSAAAIPLPAVRLLMPLLNDVLVEERLLPGSTVLAELPGTGVALLAAADMSPPDWLRQRVGECK